MVQSGALDWKRRNLQRQKQQRSLFRPVRRVVLPQRRQLVGSRLVALRLQLQRAVLPQSRPRLAERLAVQTLPEPCGERSWKSSMS